VLLQGESRRAPTTEMVTAQTVSYGRAQPATGRRENILTHIRREYRPRAINDSDRAYPHLFA
jgi:hypothetical protein